MKTRALALALAATVTFFGTTNAFADQTGTILGAAIGGATGAVIGHNLGSRGDVIIWSALGSAAGAAIGHSLSESQEREVVVHRRVRYEDKGDHRYVVVRHPPRGQYAYEEPVRYNKAERWHYHHQRDWDGD
jgi:outer membrane lipoprotein SlyB